ncbi:formate dehydrogenase major subunit [Natronincola peptidivorans]|uniref:Formate dehydrogenase major subunit n=1 Tax=Natronincola peptidivorans TaxID=426128 RepID=A0A1I0GZ90_9FIRM|nr:FAD-dependent oxidoreductase [Natronincola peptidivorans]SET76603.1 formate dehydrogenase major subunit [Natronincola peptidivorans]
MIKIRLNINGKEVIGHKGQTVLEIARENGIDIPTMCHDERVEAYGSCGLCVVEVEGIPKLLRSCATEAADGMVILTNTPKIKGSRKIALELLLSDHVGDCRPPCILACPGQTDCQGYVGLIANGQYKEALKLIKEQLPLPASIGRVCPHPCEDACRRQLVDEPISIAWLKSFVADIDLRDEDEFIPEIKPATDKRVAVIGGGPSGLTAAYYLAKEGHKVVIFEAMPQLGGMLRYGIPQYRLPKEVLNKEISIIEKMGVKMVTNMKVGRDVELEHVRKTFDAVYVSIGAWTSTKLNCPGEELEGVIGGIEFLAKFAMNEPIKTGSRIAVVGGGNTAMDACRTAIRLGAKEVYALYRRTKVEMPAEDVEVEEAGEEGITFKFLVSPTEIIGEDGKVSKIRLQKMELGEPDARGRRSPVPIEGEEEILEVDSVIASIGQSVDIEGLEALTLTKRGTLHADENSFLTNLPGVFAGGDATNGGPAIAIQAIGEGKKASEVICRYLEGETIPYKEPYYVTNEGLAEADFEDQEKEYRPFMPHLAPEIRKTNFEEIVAGYSEEDAKRDAQRCLECGCHDVFECKLLQYANQHDVEPGRLAGEVHHREEKEDHPFILRNPDKCVLCGLCVRVCDEIMGISALGVINRGFDSMVEPAFGTPLKETNCVSCGQCISVCPTGALQERLRIKKSVPVETKVTETICSYCSVGCNIQLNTKGDMLVRSIPDRESPVNDGLLCVKGRFGFDMGQKGDRITKPLVRKEGRLQEVSWEEAMLYAAKKAQGLSLLYGSNSLALSVSDRYTNEEMYLISKFGKEVLKTENIFSFNNAPSGIEAVLGYDASTNTFDELQSTETILLVGSDIMKNHPIVGLKVKKATENGGKLITINPWKSQADDWAVKKVKPSNDLDFLKGIVKALIENGNYPNAEKADGLQLLKENLENVEISQEAKEIADLYGNAKKAIIVFEQNAITVDAAKLLANMAVIAGHVGKARSGIIQLKPNSNSQGLRDMGIKTNAAEMIKAIEERNISGLLVFGEDIPHINTNHLSFLMVQDTHLTETAKKADVVLPAVTFAESEGTFTSAERRIQKLNKAIKPMVEYENWQIIIKLANTLSHNLDYMNPVEILKDIEKSNKEYFGISKLQNCNAIWPIHQSPVLYTEGFNFADKKAKLQVVGEGEFFLQPKNTNNLSNTFTALLTKENIL